MPLDEETLYAVKIAAWDRRAALYGVEKVAVDWRGLATRAFGENKIAPSKPGFWNKTKAFGKHVGEFGREMILGSPITEYQKMKARMAKPGVGLGRALAGHAKDFYITPDSKFFTALNVGMPAFDLGNTLLRGDPDTRKGDIAHGVAGIAAAPFTSRLGIPGMMIQQAVQSGAQSLGHRFDKAKDMTPTGGRSQGRQLLDLSDRPPVVPYPAPLDHPLITGAREVARTAPAQHALNAFKASQPTSG